MTSFRLIIGSLLLVIGFAVPLAAEQAVPTGEVSIAQLQQQNSDLERKVRRLERMVEAQREELNAPKSEQVIGGIGYIVGIFGGLAWFASRKKSRQEK